MKVLKANGAEIPALGLGTYALTGSQCVDIVLRALEVGYRHIDTAAFYENEEAIGAALAASDIPREEIFVTTKVWPSEVQEGLFLYLSNHGLNTNLCDFINSFSFTRDQELYRNWLNRVNDFVTNKD